jgi:hypothetical protein
MSIERYEVEVPSSGEYDYSLAVDYNCSDGDFQIVSTFGGTPKNTHHYERDNLLLLAEQLIKCYEEHKDV